MNVQFLEKLSNADGATSNEQEIRDVLIAGLEEYADEISTDHLGSIIFKKGNRRPKITLCARIDEASFIVRSISDMGQVMLISVDGVKPLTQFIQKVHITTEDGKKIHGVIQAAYESNAATKVYVDLGAQTAQEVYDLGAQVGDMMTCTTEFKHFALADVVTGEAFGDRLGCFIMGEVLRRLQGIDHPNTVYMAGTSSEEVGIHGVKTAVYRVNPDVVFPIDIAYFNGEFARSHANQRRIGKGMMLTSFDHTLTPNRALIRRIKDTASTLHKPLQLGMFNGGRTGGGEAHKNRDGKPTAVSCLSVRRRYCTYSIAHLQDIAGAVDIFTELIVSFGEAAYRASINFLKGV